MLFAFLIRRILSLQSVSQSLYDTLKKNDFFKRNRGMHNWMAKATRAMEAIKARQETNTRQATKARMAIKAKRGS